jgi:hypothetical protein
MMQSRNLETATGYLLTEKLKEINERLNTDFYLEVTDAEPMFEDWLYCLKVGDREVTDEWDGQEMFAFLCGFYHGALVGKAKHYV